MVETVPRMMSSTPGGMGELGLSILFIFSVIFRVGHLGLLGTSLYISSLQFWQRNKPGFAALFGIHVALCFDGVFLYLIVISLMFMCTIFSLLSS